MNEQQLYTSLLKGANIGQLPCADSYAETNAQALGKTTFTEERMEILYTRVIQDYGVLMEEEEEEEFKKLTESRDQKKIAGFLADLEKGYREYFIDLVSDRRKRVELVLEELSGRTQLFIHDEDITQIKKAEAQKSYPEVWRTYKTIRQADEKGSRLLYMETRSSVANYVRMNSGNDDDAVDIWSVGFHEFRKKLCKRPGEPGYYQWRPVTTEKEEKASIKTYFIRICRMRWLDVLRRISPQAGTESPDDHDGLRGTEEEEEMREMFSRAIAKLDEKCRKIVHAKFYGGNDGEGLSRKEIAQETGMKISYISKNQQECIAKLTKLYKQQLG